MIDRFGVAARLNEIAELLRLTGKAPFESRAFAKAARAIENIPTERLEVLFRQERLTEIPGVGRTIERQTRAIIEEGTSWMLDELRIELPASVVTIARAAGIAIPKARALHDALGIATTDELVRACTEQRVRAVKGFGPKTEEKILRSVSVIASQTSRARLVDALGTVERLEAFLLEHAPPARVRIAGGVRRWCEVVDEITLSMVSEAPADALDALAQAPMLSSVERRGDSVLARLPDGLRIVGHASLRSGGGLAWFRATGSEAHVAEIERRAERRGVRLDDVVGEGEEGIYAAVGLPFMPPEIRDTAAQISDVETGHIRLPLLELGDVRGMVHCHTIHSDGRDTVLAMAEKARSMGLGYLTITDHSPAAHYAGGVPVERLEMQWAELAEAEALTGVRMLRGTESDILADGSLDYPDEILARLDIVIASIHGRMKMSASEMTERITNAMRQPMFKIWGHPLGRLLLRREPFDCDVEAILDVMARSPAAIEINGDPYRLDMAPRWIASAKRRGTKFVVSSDAHSTGGMENIRFAVGMARRGGLSKDDVLNTSEAAAFEQAVRPQRSLG